MTVNLVPPAYWRWLNPGEIGQMDRAKEFLRKHAVSEERRHEGSRRSGGDPADADLMARYSLRKRLIDLAGPPSAPRRDPHHTQPLQGKQIVRHTKP